MEITLAEYAKRHGRALATVRQKAYRGGFTTAHRVGRDWFIDEAEPMVDNRRFQSTSSVWRTTVHGGPVHPHGQFQSTSSVWRTTAKTEKNLYLH